ncbi:UNVERIFIED_CONTAM: hypothetical protein RMT77_008849 [Armadillidium vulgare]
MTSEQNFQKEIDSWKPKRCENPWKPNMFNGQSEVYRRMLGILNRVTQQSVPVLLQQALELPITHPEHMSSILSLLLTKSQDEPLFTSTYAHLCAELAQKIDFQQHLSAACESHFLESLERLLQYESEFQEGVTMDDIQQEILTRKRLTVHIRFICALEKKDLIHMDKLVSMAEVLLSHGDLRSIECLCRLLSFSGSRLQNARQDIVERCFTEFQNRLNCVDLPPRLKFLLEDTIELKNNGWRPRVTQRSSGGARNHRG